DVDALVIDDGSSDDTATRARAAGARVIAHPFNLGYGAALQTGYKEALRERRAYLVQMDADGQHDPVDVPRLLAPLRAGAADVVLLLHRRGLRILEVPVTMAPSPPDRAPMHAGLRAVYYPYKMLLSTIRSALTPREEAS